MSNTDDDGEVEQCKNRQCVGGTYVRRIGSTLNPNATPHLQHTPLRNQAIDLDEADMSLNTNSPLATTRMTTLRGAAQH